MAFGGEVAEIIFQIDDIYTGAYSDPSEKCEEKNRDADSSYRASVITSSCGLEAIPGLNEDGTVTVYDELGSFLRDREEYEVLGKRGVAHYFKSEDEDSGSESGYSYEDCKWIITWIDWFREVQVITDVILKEEEIEFKVKNVQVWDDCELDPIIIPLIDCEDYNYG